MITAHELVELEGGRRPRGEHHALALAVVDVERLAVPAAADLDLVAAPHEVVLARIEREEHTHTTLGVGAEHDHVAVIRQLHVDARLVPL